MGLHGSAKLHKGTKQPISHYPPLLPASRRLPLSLLACGTAAVDTDVCLLATLLPLLLLQVVLGVFEVLSLVGFFN